MDVEAGHLFTSERWEEWIACALQRGDILETDIPVSADPAEGEGICAFLVQKVKVTLSGDLAVVVKSLESDVPSIQRDMSLAFNRKRGTLHLCGGRCIYPEAHTLHLSHFRLYNCTNYEASFITPYTKRAMAKWLDEDLIEVEDQMDELELTGDSLEESAGGDKKKSEEEAKKPKERKAKQKDPRKKKPPQVGPAADGGDGKTPGDGPIDRAALKEKLAGLRAKLLGGVAAPSGIPVELEPDGGEDEEARSGESSSRGYSPSPLPVPLQSGTHLRALGEDGPCAGDHSKETKEKKKKPSKDKEDREAQRLKDAGLLAIKDGTTSNLQRQLVARAADAAQRKKAERKHEKKKSHKMDAPAQLLRILMGKKPRKKKEEDGEKKKKKKRKFQDKKRGPPGSSDSGSSGGGSSPTPSWGDGSSEHSGESESESKELDAPLKRRSKEKPGSVLGLLVEHARQQLDQTAKVSLHQVSKDNPTLGVKLTSYFSIVVRPRLGAVTAPVRELHLLSSAMDLLRQGDLDILGDLLASRFMSVHQSIIDGSWTTAKHLELMPLEEESAAGNAIILQARKHARLASRLHNQEFWTTNAGARGRGGRGKGQQWGDSSWQGGENKGRGKKGGKGKGKNKNSWQGHQASEGDASNKTKEKVPEK